MSYTIGKQGVDRFYSDDGLEVWPYHDGAIGGMLKEVLQKGSKIDRLRGMYGYFTTPVETSIEKRSLSRRIRTTPENYHKYVVRKDLQVLSGRVAPWFGETGGGWQYRMEKKYQGIDRK